MMRITPQELTSASEQRIHKNSAARVYTARDQRTHDENNTALVDERQ